jgi:hypothetical protein
MPQVNFLVNFDGANAIKMRLSHFLHGAMLIKTLIIEGDDFNGH